MTGTYEIALKHDCNWGESEWLWRLHSSTDMDIAWGTASYRWSALWAARRAARRHAQGKAPVRGMEPKPTSIRYNVKGK